MASSLASIFHIDFDCNVISSSPGYSAWWFHTVRHSPQGLSSQQLSLNSQFTLVPATPPVQTNLHAILLQLTRRSVGLPLLKCDTAPFPWPVSICFYLYSLGFLPLTVVLRRTGFPFLHVNPHKQHCYLGSSPYVPICFVEPYGLKPFAGNVSIRLI